VRNNTVVTYTVRPDAYAEHVRLIDLVFAQLDDEQPANVDYQVMCLADGVSFVHVSSHDSADGSSPLPALAAFKAFISGLARRVATPPSSSDASTIGVYRGLSVPPAAHHTQAPS